MRRIPHIPGAVLPTVMVASILLLLTVLAVASLWEFDYLFFSKHRYDAEQRANVESTILLYESYPDEVMRKLDQDDTFLLFDSIKNSRVRIRRKPWGLYEVVSVSGFDGKPQCSKIFGKRHAYKESVGFFYRNNNSALTLTGKTLLKGTTRIPRNGIIYGQMGSVFFNGDKISPKQIKESDKELPEPESQAISNIRKLRNSAVSSDGYLIKDSIIHRFTESDPIVLTAENVMEYCHLSGNIILKAEDIEIDSSCNLNDIIIVGNNIRIRDGFKGSLQIFASDSLNIGNDVTLSYPSGLYSEKYIGIEDNSMVSGYVIVNFGGKLETRNANYKQSRLATVRGLLYVNGAAQLQGIVSGSVFLDKAVYYSPRGYYENMIYDVTILENAETAWPFWLAGRARRKEIKWVN